MEKLKNIYFDPNNLVEGDTISVNDVIFTVKKLEYKKWFFKKICCKIIVQLRQKHLKLNS